MKLVSQYNLDIEVLSLNRIHLKSIIFFCFLYFTNIVIANTEEIKNLDSSLDTNNTSQNSDYKKLPISIESDSAEQNEQLGIITYQGNVEIIQGPLRINADKIKVISAIDKDSGSQIVDQINATGSPVIFKHFAESNREHVSAEANTINYAIQSGSVTFEKNAFFSQHGAAVSGDIIEYFLEEKRVKANTNTDDKGKEELPSRVKTVIKPSLFQQAEE